MAEQFPAGFGRESFAFNERIVGKGSTECFAPANALLHGLTIGGDGHGIEPPAFFGRERIPVAECIRNIVGRSVLNCPTQDAEFFAKGGMHWNRFGGVFLEFLSRQSVGTKAAIRIFPEGWCQ